MVLSFSFMILWIIFLLIKREKLVFRKRKIDLVWIFWVWYFVECLDEDEYEVVGKVSLKFKRGRFSLEIIEFRVINI